MLTSNYRLAHRYGSFWTFERVSPPRVKTVPQIDFSAIDLQGRPERTDYIFELLLGLSGTQTHGGYDVHNSTNF
jgi:hypothetical protein